MAQWLEHTELLPIADGEKKPLPLTPVDEQRERTLFKQAHAKATKPRMLAEKFASLYVGGTLTFLGVGSYGIVFAGAHTAWPNDKVAVKVFYGTGQQSQAARFALVEEVTMLLFLAALNNDTCRHDLVCYKDYFEVNATDSANRAFMQAQLARIRVGPRSAPPERGSSGFV